MNTLIESLNHWGSRATDFAWPLLWQSSLLIGALLLLDALLRRRARAVLRYALWLLVLLKLLLPPSLALPTGLGYWLGTSHPTASTLPPPRAVSVITVSGMVPVRPASSLLAPTPPKLSRPSELLLVWLAGSAILLGFLVRRSWQAARLLRQAQPATEELQSLLDNCRRQLELRHTVRLKLSASAVSPAICGLWRPAMLLPRDLVQRLTPDQLRAVLFHELVHLQRHDVWVNCLQALLQVAYWWHPLVWLANARIRRVREEAVDEAVMVALGSQAETYPATLLEVARLAFARPFTALGLVGIFESKGALQQRIRRLLERPVPRSAKLSLTGILAVVACGALLLPMARGNRAAAPTPSTLPASGNSTAANVLVECQFLEMGEDVLRSLTAGPPALVGTNGHQAWLIPPAQGTNRLEALTKLPGVRLIAAPRLSLVSGRTGRISDSHTDSLNGRDVNLSSACEVTPRVNGTNIDLTLKASITELAEVDGNGPPVLATNAAGRVVCEVADVRVTVPDGGGVMVQNPNLQAARGRHLVLLVKPAILPEAGGSQAGTDGSPPMADPRTAYTETLLFPFGPMVFELAGQPLVVHVGVGETGPFYSLHGRQMTSEELAKALALEATAGTNRVLCIRSATNTPFHVVKTVMDTAQAAGLFRFSFGEANERRETRIFRFDATNLTSNPTLAGMSIDRALRSYLADRGVSTELPNNIYYGDRKAVLMVRATPEELDRLAQSLPTSAGMPAPNPKAEADVGGMDSHEIRTGPGRNAILSKLHRTVLDEVVFEDLPLPAVLQYLSAQALKKDPDKQGVTFLINSNVVAAATPAPFVDPSTGQVVPAPAPEPLVMGQITIKISPAMRQVRLIDVLEAVVKAADKPIKYTVDEYAVVISQKLADQAQLETRIFRVDPKTFVEGLQAVGTFPLGDSVPENAPLDYLKDRLPRPTSMNPIQDVVRAFFRAAGINLSPPHQLYYNDRKGILMVRATSQELDVIQKAVEVLNVAPAQLTIDAKFMEVPEDVVKGIPAGTVVPSAEGKAQIRILTAAQARKLLMDAEKTADAQILSMPKVTTLSGRQTPLQALDFGTTVAPMDPPGLFQKGSLAIMGTNTSSLRTKLVPLGPVLDVLPVVSSEVSTVELTVILSLTEFLGYDEETPRQFAPQVTLPVGNNVGVPIQSQLPLPIFRTRQIETKATVYDGQTLLLTDPTVMKIYGQPGGGSKTDIVSEDTRKRLLVLITPTLIDPAGNPIHTPDNLPYDPNSVPPQPK